MAHLQLLFLGAPIIELDGSPVEPDTRKAVALIAYLALTGERHTRDTLSALLWPEYDQSRSRAALRRTLSSLKSAIEGNGLLIDRDSLAIDLSANLYIDVMEFRHQLQACQVHDAHHDVACPDCLTSTTKAIELYRDDFLAGFSLRDSVNFDEWQYLQGETLLRGFVDALQFLVRCHLDREDFPTAIEYARQLLERDPLHESGHRYLMIALTKAGQRSAALRQYRECVRILDEELGVPPLEETTQLYEQIVRGDLTRVEKDSAVTESLRNRIAGDGGKPAPSFDEDENREIPSRPGLEQLPLVGRTHEWQMLSRAFNESRSDGQLVILEGEAGIGKTRLARSLVNNWRSRGRRAIDVQCYSGESGLAYGPLIESLRSAIKKAEEGWFNDVTHYALSECSRLLPEIAHLLDDLPSVQPLDRPGAQSRFFEGIRQVILALFGQKAPLLLFVDDLHWADEATVNFLAYLARRLEGQQLNMLITLRSEDINPDHRFHQVWSDGQRTGSVKIIQLKRLGYGDVHQLVKHYFDDDVDLEVLTKQLFIETEGLPFFLGEYLATLDEQRQHREVSLSRIKVDRDQPIGLLGVIQSDQEGQLQIPSTVRDLISTRLATLSETGRQLLQTGSIFGRSFDFDTLREASGRSEEESIAALEELITRGMVVEKRDDEPILRGELLKPLRSPEYVFTHEKLRTMVYEKISLARRRLLHRRVAQAMAEWPDGQIKKSALSSATATIAHHYQLGGQERVAAEYYYLAGVSAQDLYANTEALNHYQLSLALGHPDTAKVREKIGDLQLLHGEYDYALNSYEAAAAEADENEEKTDLGRLQQKLGSVYHRLGEWDVADQHYKASLSQLDGPKARSHLLAEWSLTAHRQGSIEKATTLAAEALELAIEAKDTKSLAQSHNILGILASSRGDLLSARDHLTQGLELAAEQSDPVIQIAVMNNLSRVHGMAGEVDQAINLTEEALQMCVTFGDRHHAAALYNNLADLLHASGRSEEAMIHLKKAAAIYAEIGGGEDQWRPEIWKLDSW